MKPDMNSGEVVRPSKPARGVRQPATSESLRLRAAIVAPAGARREFLARIPVRTDDGVLLIPASRVAVIAAHGSRLTITTLDQSEHSFEYRLKNLEARLDPSEFLRLNRSVIVRLSIIARISKGRSGTNKVFLENGQQLIMSRKQAVRLRRVVLAVLG